MASSPLTPIVSAIGLTTTWATVYTVSQPLTKVGIDAVVFNNYSSNNVTFSARIVQVGTAGVLNEIITDKNIRAEGNDLAPAMIGQSVVLGGVVQVKASANDSVSVSITGTTFT